MNLKTIKELDTPKLRGIKFDWVKEDGYPRELRLTDEAGAHVIIRTSDYGSLRILIEEPEEPKIGSETSRGPLGLD